MLYILLALIVGIPLLTFLIAFLTTHKVIFIILVISLFIKLLIDFIRNKELKELEEAINLINKELSLAVKNKSEAYENWCKVKYDSEMYKRFKKEMEYWILEENKLIEKKNKLAKDLTAYEQSNNKNK
jgi:biopolymer transport protein ExbB/TolQ